MFEAAVQLRRHLLIFEATVLLRQHLLITEATFNNNIGNIEGNGLQLQCTAGT